MTLLSRAITLLHNGNYTCVLCDRNRVLTSKKSGIAPLLERIEAKEDLVGICAADKIIGKAAAMLLILGGAKAVYGDVMSGAAKDLLTASGIDVCYGTLTKQIVNRKGDGPCPMELTVADLTDPADAPKALRATLERLKRSQ